MTRLYDKQEICGDLLHLSLRKLNLMVAAGEFPKPLKIGRLCRWTQEQIDQFFQTLNARAGLGENDRKKADANPVGRPRKTQDQEGV